MTQTMLASLAAILVAMLVLWIISLIRRDASIVDAFWGMGFVIVAWIAWSLNSPAAGRLLVLAVLTSLWGLRLSLYLFWRNLGHGEDRRYAAMRAHHGNRFWWVSLFTVFLLQGAILWFVAMPLQATLPNQQRSGVGILDAAGVMLWCVGFCFESVGDWQLARFKANPANAGRVMDRGLWRYTRHPNYFGDFCVWWGLYFIAAAGGAWWTVASPLLMTLLLMKVSGVVLLEKSMADSRPEYAAYRDRTSTFFPWFPLRTQHVGKHESSRNKSEFN